MKAWEETWSFDDDNGLIVIDGGGIRFGPPSREQVERARLASAAPEMARVLATLAKQTGWCAFCEVTIYEDWEACHDDDCPILAPLRKAGVLKQHQPGAVEDEA